MNYSWILGAFSWSNFLNFGFIPLISLLFRFIPLFPWQFFHKVYIVSRDLVDIRQLRGISCASLIGSQKIRFTCSHPTAYASFIAPVWLHLWIVKWIVHLFAGGSRHFSLPGISARLSASPHQTENRHFQWSYAH